MKNREVDYGARVTVRIPKNWLPWCQKEIDALPYQKGWSNLIHKALLHFRDRNKAKPLQEQLKDAPGSLIDFVCQKCGKVYAKVSDIPPAKCPTKRPREAVPLHKLVRGRKKVQR